MRVAGACTLSQVDAVVDPGGDDTLPRQNPQLPGLPAGWIFG